MRKKSAEPKRIKFTEDPVTVAIAKLYSDTAQDMEPHHFSSRIYQIIEIYNKKNKTSA